jgi:hypothetical protein
LTSLVNNLRNLELMNNEFKKMYGQVSTLKTSLIKSLTTNDYGIPKELIDESRPFHKKENYETTLYL